MMSDTINGNGLSLEYSVRAILEDLSNGSGRVMKEGASIYLEKAGISDQWIIVERYSDVNSRPTLKKFKTEDIKEAIFFFMG
ncbi:MAG: hypothetical protein COV66_04445 [Nitrospinae bacterium CG11_big_fil_rev_8_21_14_0_20_45_15]|nr:MAG: hypothetical protein COV66_04445 [Nitrospinae bacterium CG11_big_fil_rev_8_21_14_0_20_45_15]